MKKNRLGIYIGGMVASIILWFASPFIFPHNWFWKKEFCDWNSCIQATPEKGLIIYAIIIVIFIIFSCCTILKIKDIIKEKKNKL